MELIFGCMSKDQAIGFMKMSDLNEKSKYINKGVININDL